MSKILRYRVAAAVVLALLSSAPVLGQVSLTNDGFKENFDSMGQYGTAPPAGWSHYIIPGGNDAWQPSKGGIPENEVSGGILGPKALPVTGYFADVISDKD